MAVSHRRLLHQGPQEEDLKHNCTDQSTEPNIRDGKGAIVEPHDLLTDQSLDGCDLEVYVLIHCAQNLCKTCVGTSHVHYVQVALFDGVELREVVKTKAAHLSTHPVFHEELFLGTVTLKRHPTDTFKLSFLEFIVRNEGIAHDTFAGRTKLFLAKDETVCSGLPIDINLKCHLEHEDHKRGTLKVSIILKKA